MARDRANINTNLWADQDWRDIPKGAKYLYLMLLSHPTLSYVGVADWRIGRLAAMSPDDTTKQLHADAQALQDARFIFIDEDTEEVLIRSFLRHDGLLKQPKLSISMVNAFASATSKPIRQIITNELQRLQGEFPEWAAFRQSQVQTMLKAEGKDMAEFTQGVTPEVTQGFTLNGDRAQALPTTTATTTATEPKGSSPDSEAKKPATRLPKNWAPTAVHIKTAKEKNVDVMNEAENFRLHAETHDRRAANWNGAFATWLKKATEMSPQKKPNPNSPWNPEYHK